ncbi:MAG: DUF1211 domain-containing protein [Planctomycetes bacterium]|nr:DUF1211 domain-containing protein [Planctomycetota bacterium]MBI3836271.1 DUF1211 domain-containing protein [Planctomycetota bacterium]
MDKGRLEAFSDGVIAIIITIMVLEMKVPHGADLDALRPVLPAFLSYLLSFIYVGIYWNNHHHLFHAVQRVSGMALWSNLHLLFWLSLIPFVTRWMGESHFGTSPVAAYGAVLLMCAVAWEIIRRLLLRCHDRESALVKAIGDHLKEWVSLFFYAVAIGMAFVNTWVACALYGLVAATWFVPDRRIEREIESGSK